MNKIRLLIFFTHWLLQPYSPVALDKNETQDLKKNATLKHKGLKESYPHALMQNNENKSRIFCNLNRVARTFQGAFNFGTHIRMVICRKPTTSTTRESTTS